MNTRLRILQFPSILLILLIINSTSFAQELSSIQQVIDKVKKIKKERKFKELVKYTEDLMQKLPIKENTSDTLQAFFLYNQAYAYYNLGDYKKAISSGLESKQIQEKHKNSQSETYIHTSHLLANIYYVTGSYKKAEKEYQSLLVLARNVLGEKNEVYLIGLNDFALLYKKVGKFKEAEEMYIRVLDAYEKYHTKEHPVYAACLGNLALLYSKLGRYSEVETLFLKALDIHKKISGEQDPHYATNLGSLAQLYKSVGRFSEAEPLYLEAIKIYENKFGEAYPKRVTLINNLAVLYVGMEKYGEAENRYQESLKLTKLRLGNQHPKYATILVNLAGVYREMESFQQAEKLLLQALKIHERLGKKHYKYLTTLSGIARLKRTMKEYDVAIEIYLEIQKIYTKTLGKRHTKTIIASNNLVRCYLEKGEAEKAWEYVALGVEYMTGQSISYPLNKEDIAALHKVKLKNYAYLKTFLKTIKYAFILLDSEKQTTEVLQRKALLVELALHLIEQRKYGLSSPKDQLKELKLANAWIVQGLNILHSQKGEALDYAKIFSLIERNKSVLLHQATQADANQRLGNLPEELFEKEKILQGKRIDLEALIAQQQEQEKDSLRTILNKVNMEIEAFNKQLEHNYPKYAALKRQEKGVELQAVQDQLDAETALIEYLIGDSTTYLFYADQETTVLYSIPISSYTLKDSIQSLHNILSDYKVITDQPQQAYDAYCTTAHWFYQTLVARALVGKSKIKKLVFITDRELGYLPFEAFLSELPPQQKFNYKNLSYLLRDYQISYDYSATLWEHNIRSEHKSNNGELFAIAANYSRKVEDKAGYSYGLKGYLAPLPAARTEVETLAKNFNGLFALDSLATEQIFKQESKNYGIIHLAMHGLSNKSTPMLSGLAFTQSQDSSQNDFLQAYEISRLDLNASLVVLSACKTGYGKFEVGNGIASLARAFMYAEVPA
ncbi:MAG: CHAT domain-containing protein, partial [Saprospiraceae bacterium]|nr:CHAT domain-containing protein [Saprospiraceae bacterium]